MRNGRAELPVLLTAAEAYRFVLADIGTVAKVSTVPFVIMTSISVAFALYPNLWVLHWSVWIVVVAFYLLWIPFQTKWYRVTLRGPEFEVPLVGLEVGQREVNFLFYEIMLSILVALFAAVPAFLFWQTGTSVIAVVSVPPFAAASIYIGSRLLLVFPAAALGIDASLNLTWRQSAGNGWRLFLVVVIAAIPWITAEMILEAVLDLTRSPTVAAFLTPINNAVAFLSAAVLVSCLSIAYLHLDAAHRGDDGDVPPGAGPI